MTAPAPRRLLVALAALAAAGVAAPAVAQSQAAAHARLVAELGDPARGEAAVLALVAAGESAVPALQELLEAPLPATEPGRLQLAAALLVVDLLGPAAGALHDTLVGMLDNSRRDWRKRDPEPELTSLVTVVEALASMAPCEGENRFHQLFHNSVVQVRQHQDFATQREVFAALARYSARNRQTNLSVEQALTLLENQEFGCREVAAEVVAAQGGQPAAAALRAALLQRQTAPKGHDQLSHNGLPVLIRDRFELVAGRALLRVAPDEPSSAIGHAMVALHHPLRIARREAVRGLVRCGPHVADAVPELLQLASGGDVEIAAEALKALMMAGEVAGPHLAAIEVLATHADAKVARLAGNLAGSLRARGIVPTPIDPALAEAAQQLQRVRSLVAGLRSAEPDAATTAALLAAPELAWACLVDRLREEGSSLPDQVVPWFVRLGLERPASERELVGGALVLSGSTWQGQGFSAMQGGNQPSAERRDAFAALTIGASPELAGLAPFLSHENCAVRLEAARRCAAAPAATAAADGPLHDALWQAVVGEHPKQSPLRRGNMVQQMDFDLADRIRTYAAAALRATPVSAAQGAVLFGHGLRFPDPDVMAACIVAFGPHAALAELERLAKGEEGSVAADAAQTELQRRGRR